MPKSKRPKRADKSRHTVVIGSRASPLAVAQAEAFAIRLSQVTGDMIVAEIKTFKTTGDRIQDRPLQDAGGKGLFTKELDRAQKHELIDIGVHSLKDVTVKLNKHLTLACFLPREDPRDCLIGPVPRIADLPEGAVVGTSSVRRRAQLLALRPDLKIVEFRGNVQTRLGKLRDGVADATLLAAAGLNRLDQMEVAAGVLSVDEVLPAAGQGIVAATIRKDAPEWLHAACAAADDADARLAAAAERAFLRRLDGSCRTPFAAYFRLTAEGAEMQGEALALDGSKRWQAMGQIPRRPSERDAEELGLIVAEDIAAQRASAP